jgi:hypothetical protein
VKFWIFVDTPYYPYVDEPVETDTPEEARAIAAGSLRPGDETTIYVVPADAVSAVRMHGPKTRPVGLLALQQEINDLRKLRLEAGYSIIMESGSTRPEAG